MSINENLLDQYEPNSLISKLLDVHKDSDVPPNFYRWGALAISAAVSARNNYFTFMDEAQYLNLYILLTADSGNRKSVALRHCKELLDQIGYYHFMPAKLNSSSLYTACQPEAKALRAKLTANVKERKERMALVSTQIDRLKGRDSAKEKGLRNLRLSLNTPDADGSMLRAKLANQLAVDVMVAEGEEELFTETTEIGIWADEFINVYDKPNGDLTMFLNDIYDPVDYFSVKGAKVIYQPIVNMFACITPAGLGGAFNGASFLNGMLPRTHVVYGQAMRGNQVDPFNTKRDLGRDLELVAHLNKMQEIKGEMILPPEVTDKMNTIYTIHRNADDPRLAGYKDRSLVHLAKIACNLALGRLSNTVSVEDVMYASSIMLYTESQAPAALGDFANTPDAKARSLIKKVLERTEGTLAMSEILGQVMAEDSSISEMTAQASLHSLVNMKEIKKLVQSGSGNTSSITIFAAVPKETEHLSKFNGITFSKDFIPEAEW